MVTFHVLAIFPRLGVEAWHVFTVGTDRLKRHMVTFTEETASKLATFFGLTAPTFKSPATVKQTSDRLKDVIENYNEVNDAFLRTPHSWMLDAI